MLTVKVKKNINYLLPPNCAYCNAELPKENTITQDGVSVNIIQSYDLLKHRLFTYGCPKCKRLYSESRVFTLLLPFIILIIGLLVGSSLPGADKTIDLTTGIFLMIGLLASFYIVFTFGNLLAVLYIKIRGERWSIKTAGSGPARKTRKFREKGYHFFNFSNDDFGRAFAKLNQGQVISSSTDSRIGF